MTLEELRTLNNKTRRKPSHKEDDLQIACVKWFKYQYPNILIHHSPNGGRRNLIEAKRFKDMGVKSGFPDLFIAMPSGAYHGLFCELKDGKKGRVSDNQKEVIAYLSDNNYKTEVVRSLEDFINCVSLYFNHKI